MLSCKEISELVSRSLDERLGWRARIELTMHLAMCRLCGKFSRHVKQLRRKLEAMPEPPESAEVSQSLKLSTEARARIGEALRQS